LTAETPVPAYAENDAAATSLCIGLLARGGTGDRAERFKAILIEWRSTLQ
jgi:hypothetical protein